MKLEKLTYTLKNSWSKDTCFETQSEEWGSDNPSLGQCYITALIVNDYFGGFIVKSKTSTGVNHYWNRLGGVDIDLTKEQFSRDVKFFDKEIVSRDNLSINSRYIKLKERVEKFLTTS